MSFMRPLVPENVRLPRKPLLAGGNAAAGGTGLVYSLVIGGMLLVFGSLAAVGVVGCLVLRNDDGPQVAVNNPARPGPNHNLAKVEPKAPPPWREPRKPDPLPEVKTEEPKRPELPTFIPPPVFPPNLPKIEVYVPPRVVQEIKPLKLPPTPAPPRRQSRRMT